MWPWKREERAAEGYTDALIAASLASASGTDAAVGATAAAEFAAGLLGRALASADVSPTMPALSPALLEGMGRGLLLQGNAVYQLDVQESGLYLLPAASWELSGGARPDLWRYRLTLSTPSGNPILRTLPADAVVHVRMGAHPSTPWAGVSPLKTAGLSSAVLANIERGLSLEARVNPVQLLPIPGGMAEDKVEALKTGLRAQVGKVGLVETTAAGFGQGRQEAPHSDWQPRRVGLTVPAANVELREQAAAHVLAATGCPPQLMLSRGDGAAVREAYRRALYSWIAPIGRLIASELSAKLDREIAFDFKALAAGDVAARARALGGLVQAGVGLEEALLLAGLNES